MLIEARALNDVTPYANNPREIPDVAVTAVAESIRRYGFRQPIVVDPEGVIIVGHVRLLAAKQLGLETVPVHIADLTPDEARAYRLADNRSNEDAMWDDAGLLSELKALAEVADNDLSEIAAMTAFSERELQRLLIATIDPEPDAVDPPAPRAKVGDLWVLGRHRLMCGDATNESNLNIVFDGTRPDCILTDPPYSSGGFQEANRSQGSKGTCSDYTLITNDRLSSRGYMALMKQVLVIAPVEVLYMFTDWRMWVSAFDVAESAGYGVRSMIVWDKGVPGMGQGWRSQHELILCGTKSNGLWVDYLGVAQGNVISLPRIENEFHPTQKPVELLEVVLRNTPFAKTIYDPMTGSGTTIIAAERQGRACYAMEIEPQYVDMAIARWEALTGLTAATA